MGGTGPDVQLPPLGGGCEPSPEDALPTAMRVVDVKTSEELAAAIEAAAPGDHIVLADGTYRLGKIMRSGTETAPIVIRAANLHGAVFNEGQLELSGASYVILSGLEVTTDASIKLTSCHHVRLTRLHLHLTEESSMKWLIIQGADSHHNRIDHNLFDEKAQTGNFITLDGSETQQSQYDRIDHNHFRNIGPRAANEKEALRIGWSEISESSGFTQVDCNLFEDCDGDPEIISVKSCDNTLKFNTIRRSQGALSLRHGDRSVVYGNFILGEGKAGTGGIRVYGKDHQVLNNYLSGLTGSGYDAPLQLDGGDADQSGALSSHFRVYRAVVAFNTFVDNQHGIELGANYTKPPVGTTLANNLIVGSTGRLIDLHQTPVAEVTWLGNLAFAAGAASLGAELGEPELRVTDPKLAQGPEGVAWLPADSPAINAGMGTFEQVTEDIQGQPRDATPDVGADEWSAGAAARRPLTAADVGPMAP